jgi:DNA-binding winged helix-turn-helix (wHTH) protein
MPPSRTSRCYRFGTFEADAATGELRRQGIRVKLNAQPFQLLLLLLEQQGELLTREEIARELWPDGTFTDYEHGVNSALNRLRDALGDTASNPRYVETLARRGYRFIAPVTCSSPANGDAQGASEPPTLAESAPAHGETANYILASAAELPAASHRVVQTLFVLLQLMYLGFYVGALANLAEIQELLAALPASLHAFTVLVVTAAAMLPVRVFVLFLVLFRAPQVRQKFFRIWPLILLADELWSLAPFLLLHHINFGLALAATAILVYAPFAQRSLVLMGAGGTQAPASA